MLVAIIESQAGTRGMFLKGESLDHTYGLSHDCLNHSPKNLFSDYDSIDIFCHFFYLSFIIRALLNISIYQHRTTMVGN